MVAAYPLSSYPLPIHKPITSQQSHIMVDEAIRNPVQNHCTIRMCQKPYLCRPLLVVENS